MQRSFHQSQRLVKKGSFVCGLVVSADSLTVHTRNVLWPLRDRQFEGCCGRLALIYTATLLGIQWSDAVPIVRLLTRETFLMLALCMDCFCVCLGVLLAGLFATC